MRVTSTLPEISLDFSYFDNLYSGDQGQYTEMLDLYVQEYNIYKTTISEAIATGNETEFRKAKHKIIYSLDLLKLDSVRSHLDEMAEKLPVLQKGELAEESKVLDGVFSIILERLAEKKVRAV